MNDQKAQLIADEMRDVSYQLKRIADVLEKFPLPVEIGEPIVKIRDMDKLISAVRRER